MRNKFMGSSKGLTIAGPAGTAHISDTFNTGYMLPDTQLAALCETETGSITTPELVTNGTFDTDTSGWTVLSGATLSKTDPTTEAIDTQEVDGLSAPSSVGIIKIVSNGGGSGASQSVSTVVGNTYTLTVRAYQVAASSNKIWIGTSAGGSQIADIEGGNFDSGTTLDSWAETTIKFTATTSITYISLITSQVAARISYWDEVTVKEVVTDHSGNNNHLNVVGTLNRSPIGNGEIAAWSGFSASNYLEMPYDAALDVGTGDICVAGWVQKGASTAQQILFQRDAVGANVGNGALELGIDATTGKVKALTYDGSSHVVTSSSALPDNEWAFFAAVVRSGTMYVYVNGIEEASGNAVSIGAVGHIITFGIRTNHTTSPATTASMALWRISKTAPSADQIAKMYRDEKAMLEGKAVLDGNDPAVKALAYDKERDLLRVASSGVVSTFRGLERVASSLDGKAELVTNGGFDTDTGWIGTGTGNWTIQGGQLEKISTVNTSAYQTITGLTVGAAYLVQLEITGNTSGGGVSCSLGGFSPVVVGTTPGVYTKVLIAGSADQYFYITQGPNTGAKINWVSLKKISPAAPFTALSAHNGGLTVVGTNGVDLQLPEVSIRERLAQALPKAGSQREDFFFTGDGTQVSFTLPSGWKPKRIWVDGSKQRVGSAEDYEVKYDGFKYSAVFAVAPVNNAEIDIEATDA